GIEGDGDGGRAAALADGEGAGGQLYSSHDLAFFEGIEDRPEGGLGLPGGCTPLPGPPPVKDLPKPARRPLGQSAQGIPESGHIEPRAEGDSSHGGSSLVFVAAALLLGRGT